MPVKIKDAEGNEVEILTSEEQTKMITGAVNRSLKTSQEDMIKKVAESVSGSIQEFETRFAAQLEGSNNDDDDSGDAGAKGDEANKNAALADIEKHPQFRGLKKQLEDLKKRAEEADARATAERQKQRDASLRAQVTDHLTKVGLNPKAIKQALMVLVDGEKRVRYAEDGDDLLFTDESGDDLDLASGIESWGKSEAAQFYMPARGTSGSGGRPAGGAKPAPRSPATDLGRQLLSMANSMDSGAMSIPASMAE